jgi:hypothetical protein
MPFSEKVVFGGIESVVIANGGYGGGDVGGGAGLDTRDLESPAYTCTAAAGLTREHVVSCARITSVPRRHYANYTLDQGHLRCVEKTKDLQVLAY